MNLLESTVGTLFFYVIGITLQSPITQKRSAKDALQFLLYNKCSAAGGAFRKPNSLSIMTILNTLNKIWNLIWFRIIFKNRESNVCSMVSNSF